MKSRIADKQDGQTLVQVAILLTVLLAFLALAIDVGYMYAGRRQMQNAADAGALAGAYEICFGEPSQWKDTAEEYAISRNGAQEATAERFPNEWTVNVVARQTVDLFVADVIGLPEVEVGAEAAAACGQAVSTCGLWPVTISQAEWNRLLIEVDEDGNTRGCGNPFYIWSGNQESNTPDCDVYDCNVPDENGETDEFLDVVTLPDRGWVDFSDVVDPLVPSCSAPGCGTNELVCYIEDDSTDIVVKYMCMPGLTGIHAGAKTAVDSRIDDEVGIPIFDGTCDTARSCPGGDRYKIVDFGCITVLGWVHQLTLPRQDGANPPWKGKTIQVEVNCEPCESLCGSTIGAPPVVGGVNAVSLIK